MLSPSRRLKFKHTHMHTLSVCWAVPVSWLGLFQVLSCNPYFPHSVKLPVFFCFEAPLIPPPLRSKKPRLCNLDCELCCVTRSMCQRECKHCSLLSQSTFFSMFHTYHSQFFFHPFSSCYSFTRVHLLHFAPSFPLSVSFFMYCTTSQFDKGWGMNSASSIMGHKVQIISPSTSSALPGLACIVIGAQACCL